MRHVWRPADVDIDNLTASQLEGSISHGRHLSNTLVWQAVRNCLIFRVSSFILDVIQPYFKAGVHKFQAPKFYTVAS
jgi:hypothetical protein